MRIEKKTNENTHLMDLKSLKQLSRNTKMSFFAFTQSTTNIMQQEDCTGQPVEFKTAAQVTPKDFAIWFRMLLLMTLDFVQALKRLLPLTTLMLYSLLFLHYTLILKWKISTGFLSDLLWGNKHKLSNHKINYMNIRIWLLSLFSHFT